MHLQNYNMAKKQNSKLKEIQTAKTSKISKIRKTLNTALSLIAASTLSYMAYDYYSTNSQKTNYLEQKNYNKLETAVLSPELAEAIKYPQKRQDYLDNLTRNSKLPYCSGIIYDPTGEKLVNYLLTLAKSKGLTEEDMKEGLIEARRSTANGNFDMKTPEILNFMGQGIKSKIFVGKEIFKGEYSESEIKSGIVDHEERHAEQIARGMGELGYLDTKTLIESVTSGEISVDCFYDIGELDALGKEISEYEKMQNKEKHYFRAVQNYRLIRRGIMEAMPHTKGNFKKLLEKTLELNPKK